MAKVLINDEYLTDIANAIREKNSQTTEYKPKEMASAISNIPSGGGGDNEMFNALIDRTITDIYYEGTVIGGYAFQGCNNLTPIITEANFPNVTELKGAAFYSCTPITEVNLPKVNTFTGINQFYKCTNLTTINFPSLKSTNQNAFQECSKLSIINLPALEEVGNACFRDCKALQEISLPQTKTIYGGAFQGCTNLTTINLPIVKNMGNTYIFRDCSSLAKIDLPATLTSDIYDYTFYQCSVLETLILRTTSKVLKLKTVRAFQGTPIASGTGYIYVPSDLIDTYKSTTNWSTYANQFRAIEDYPEITGG